ncbi:Tetratricopeptide repeat [Ostreococcus tauri]|uniref:Tetratricopeptide repeat n=1 Tax=Ostreococcus tauri TaxID=70448 RepID=A0A090M8Y8_OSTTA|nr:Tetratricopeptide repeat [Ostreococcus tauri]CEF98589.1 Tetratricopeptide repeat [Ostreococcus tauri]|eukprot:XP_003080165.2 Tetratricopeptide repeat [Ostreococcus tauri]
MSVPGAVFARAPPTRAREDGARGAEATTDSLASLLDACERRAWTSIVARTASSGGGGGVDARAVVTLRALALARLGRGREAGEALATGTEAGDARSFAEMALEVDCAHASGDGEGGMDAMCALHALCAKREGEANGEAARETWRRRRRTVARATASRYMMADDPRAALVWIDIMSRDEPDEPEHLSSAGRAHLMMGDLEGARLCFNEAERLVNALGEGASAEQRARVLCNRGDYFLVGAKYPEARAAYGAALLKDEGDVAAKVNAAVASVYMGDLDSSRTLLEDGLVAAANAPDGSKARDFITPSAVKNLQSIYELTARAPAEAKHGMNAFIKVVAPEDFDVTCLTS